MGPASFEAVSQAGGPVPVRFRRRPPGLTCEQVEFVVELQQLEGAPGSPALLFGQAVVNVPLVFGGAAHPDL